MATPVGWYVRVGVGNDEADDGTSDASEQDQSDLIGFRCECFPTDRASRPNNATQESRRVRKELEYLDSRQSGVAISRCHDGRQRSRIFRIRGQR